MSLTPEQWVRFAQLSCGISHGDLESCVCVGQMTGSRGLELHNPETRNSVTAAELVSGWSMPTPRNVDMQNHPRST